MSSDSEVEIVHHSLGMDSYKVTIESANSAVAYSEGQLINQPRWAAERKPYKQSTEEFGRKTTQNVRKTIRRF